MSRANRLSLVVCGLAALIFAQSVSAEDIKKSDLCRRIRTALDAVPAIDTHDHLRPFEEIPGRDLTDKGRGMTLRSIWGGSYYTWINPLSAWPEGKAFDVWWGKAKHDFDDARATSFYRYVLPAFKDLYGIDFETMTDEQARELNDRIFANDQTDKWLHEVITERANIELMFIDPYWARFKFERAYRFAVPVLNVTTLVDGYHESSFASELDSPYFFMRQQGKEIKTLDDYLAALDAIFAKGVASDCACLKTTLAYQRTLEFANVPRERAEKVFGRKKAELTAEEIKDFQDFILWRLCELSAKHDLPFQIHTGQARIQGSNPMLLVDMIAANPKTKFILFHGGFPWVGETGVIAMKYRNVWVDSVWLPQLSYTMAKRAYQEWLEVMPSDRIMWGADTTQAEGIYAATVWTRQCVSEALAEKVDRGELREEQAIHIGTQILRENALKLFPKLRRQLWKKDELPKTRAALESGQPAKIVCFGDSVTGVYYHTGGRRAYTDMLGIALKQAYPKVELTMINAGISGHATTNALERIERDVLAHEPTLVTVMFGLNDMVRVPLEEYRANLNKIIDQCQAAGAEVLLCTPNNVISTTGRPTEKLATYCDAIRSVGKERGIPVCDTYAALESLRNRDSLAWRLLLSDEIHPNMDGHKRMAEILAKSISGKEVSLADVPPPTPVLAKTKQMVKENKPVKVLAMPPLDATIISSLKEATSGMQFEVIPWQVAGKTLTEIEKDAQARVRALKPDLVVIAVPRSATAASPEQFIRSYAWIMNWSLSFGIAEWDCVVVHPSVLEPDKTGEHDDLVRQLVRAQDLTLVDRANGDKRQQSEMLAEALRK